MIEFYWLKFNLIHEHSHDKPTWQEEREGETYRNKEMTQTGLIIDRAELAGQVN